MSRSLGSLAGHQVSMLPHPNSKEAPMFSLLQMENTIYQFRTLPFCLTTVPKTFTRIAKSISLHCQKMAITPFQDLDNGLQLAELHMQAGIDGQRVASLLQKLGCLLSQDKCQLKPTKAFTHLRSYIQHQGYGHLITQGQGTGHASLSCQGSFIT